MATSDSSMVSFKSPYACRVQRFSLWLSVRKPRGFWRTLGQSGVAQPLRLAAGRVYLPAAACKTVYQFTSAPFQIQTNRGYSVGSLRLFAAGSTNLPLKNRKSAPAGQALPVQSSAKKPSTNCKANSTTLRRKASEKLVQRSKFPSAAVGDAVLRDLATAPGSSPTVQTSLTSQMEISRGFARLLAIGWRGPACALALLAPTSRPRLSVERLTNSSSRCSAIPTDAV
mmetsp:Transcript_38291/g.63163  ORF Transcript_38291/g.63163 Transcript_38291/m.63163 type:complete len:227 (+) Transcript_38291:547-1227(+)